MNLILELFFGLGIFLYGMSQLETGAKDLSGHRLRTWLLRSTQSPFSSAVSGTVITAVLQSSSLVGLIVLAFASAGVIPFYNAVGVLLGANLGTTITGWLVALLGFKLDLNHLALPFIALGGLSQVVFGKTFKGRAYGQVVLGIGLVLFGLSIMKDSVANVPELVPLQSLQGHSPLTYLIFGLILTAIIQSSSASMMIALAALHGGLIELPDAAALVIGADLGTTSTVILGSLTGNIIKKQLAFAHCIFNLVVDACAFALLLPLLPTLQSWLRLSDPLFTLVAFHSTFNLLGLMIFAPFLKYFSSWIEKIITSDKPILVLQKIPTSVPEAALPPLKETVKQLWMKVLSSNMKHFHIDFEELNLSESEKTQFAAWLEGQNNKDGNDPEQNYESIKSDEGSIVQFTLKLQQQPLNATQTQFIIDCLDATRSLVYCSKTLKDIAHNLRELLLQRTEQDEKYLVNHKQYQLEFYQNLIHLLLGNHDHNYLIESIQRLQSMNDAHHQKMDKLVYYYDNQPSRSANLNTTHISSLLNVNREIHHANKNILLGLQRWITIGDIVPNEMMANV